jgi:hypothetical protein
LANVHGIRKKILFSGMRQISPMRICNFEKFPGVIPGPDPLKKEKIGKEGVGQGNGREGKIEERKLRGRRDRREVPLSQILDSSYATYL